MMDTERGNINCQIRVGLAAYKKRQLPQIRKSNTKLNLFNANRFNFFFTDTTSHTQLNYFKCFNCFEKNKESLGTF